MIFDRVGQGAGVGTRWWGGGPGGGIPDMEMGFQTQKTPNLLYRWMGPLVMIFNRVSAGDGVPDMEMGFQTWGWGSRQEVGF